MHKASEQSTADEGASKWWAIISCVDTTRCNVFLLKLQNYGNKFGRIQCVCVLFQKLIAYYETHNCGLCYYSLVVILYSIQERNEI